MCVCACACVCVCGCVWVCVCVCVCVHGSEDQQVLYVLYSEKFSRGLIFAVFVG